MTLCASLKALVKFPCFCSERKATLSGHSEWITGDPGARAFSGSDDDRQRFIFHLNQIERIPRRIAILGNDRRDSLTDVTDFVDGEDVVFGNSERFVAAANGQSADLIFDFRACDDGDNTGMLACRVRLKAFDLRVSVGGSQNGNVERVRQVDIVHVLTKPANQSWIFAALNPGTYKLTDGHSFHPVLDFRFWILD